MKIFIVAAAAWAAGALLGYFVARLAYKHLRKRLRTLRQERKPPKKKMGTMDRILVLEAVFLVAYTVADLVVFWHTGSEPATLTGCVFGVCGLENVMQFLEELGVFRGVLPLCVSEDRGCTELLDALLPFAVESPHYFPDDAYTDMPEKALVAEVLREKMLLNLRDEIPHGTAVTVERFKERGDKDIIDIDVNIYCEKKSHKGMIIGKGGQMLKKIASEARMECEEFLGARVNLQCWVKIKDDWRDNDFLLNNFGFQK